MPAERYWDSTEIVERIDKNRSALIWENFLKYLANSSTEAQAREYLENKLQEYINAPPTEFKAPLLQDADEDVAELVKFLKGELKPKKSKIWPLLERERAEDGDDEYQESLELRRSYFEAKEKITKIIDLTNIFFKQIETAREELRPIINKLPFAPDEYELEIQFTKLNRKITKLKHQFIKLTTKFGEEQILRNWAAEDNLRQNPDGIREATKWINGILSKLNTISASARLLMEQLGQIDQRLNWLNKQTATKKIDADQT